MDACAMEDVVPALRPGDLDAAGSCQRLKISPGVSVQPVTKGSSPSLALQAWRCTRDAV